MNLIDRKFLYYRTQNAFEQERERVSPGSIVFIEDKRLIWTHNTYFGLSTGFERAKGYFISFEWLKKQYPKPLAGDWAIVPNDKGDLVIATCATDGIWILTEQPYNRESFDVSEFLKRDDIDFSNYVTFADLVPYLKEGDLNLALYPTRTQMIQAISQMLASYIVPTDSQLSTTSTNPLQNKIITEELSKKLEAGDLEDYVKTSDVADLINNRVIEIMNAIDEAGGEYNIKEEVINQKIAELTDLINDINSKYISWFGDQTDGGSEEGSTPVYQARLVTIPETEYQEMLDAGTIDENTYYFTY